MELIFYERLHALVARIKSLLRWGLVLFCVPKENQKSTRYFRGAGGDGLRLPASASLPLASCWPLPQQLLPVSAAGGGRRRCKKGAARPFQTPKERSKRKKASRCAKTGCGAQRPLRALSGTRVLLTAAPTAPPCIRRRRWSSLLHFFLVSPTCCFAAGVTPLQGVKFSGDVKSSAEP